MCLGESCLPTILYNFLKNILVTVLLIISALSTFSTPGCASLHHRCLGSMLIPLKLCRGQLRVCASDWSGNAYDALVSRRSDWQVLSPSSPCAKCTAHFWPAQLSHWLAASLLFQVPGAPLHTANRQPCFRVPLNARKSGDMTLSQDCSLCYPAAWWLGRLSHFSACPSSWLRLSHEESFTPLIRNFAVPLHFIFLLENLIFSFSYPKVVI